MHPTVDDINVLLKFYRDMGMEYVENSAGIEALLALLREGRRNPKPVKKDRLLSMMEKACSRCPRSAGTQGKVHGTGSRPTRLLVAGEFPLREDIQKGAPFQGEAGNMLTKMLRAIGIDRNEIWLTLAVKCRLSGDRGLQDGLTWPLKESHGCKELFLKEIEEIRPAFILSFGVLPAQFIFSRFRPHKDDFLHADIKVADLRGGIITLGELGIKMVVTHSPASILRQPQHRIQKYKKEAWHDLQLLEKLYSRKK